MSEVVAPGHILGTESSDPHENRMRMQDGSPLARVVDEKKRDLALLRFHRRKCAVWDVPDEHGGLPGT
jgi:hypothetical protein